MNDLFDKIASLLGQTYDSDAFKSLVYELEEKPQIIPLGKNKHIAFARYGFAYRTAGDVLCAAEIHIDTPSVFRSMNPYSAPLLAGISTSDDRKTVSEKIGVKPIRSIRTGVKSNADNVDVYEVNTLRMYFTFDHTDVMCSVGLNLIQPRSGHA